MNIKTRKSIQISKIRSYINTTVRNIIMERVNNDDSTNLHFDSRTQRQFVIDLAKKLGGYITLSDIATALGVTNDDVKDNYGRLIRYFNNRENDFVKVVPEVPFRSAAIYQYVGADKSERQLDLSTKKEEELKKFQESLPYYYNIRKRHVNQGLITVAFLRIRRDENINDYINMLPTSDLYYLDKTPFVDNPGKKFKILGAIQFQELCDKLRQI